MSLACYAHSIEGRPPADWEPLEDHLTAVARLTARFADTFQAAAWGELAGRWHDLGKYSLAFQAYLYRENGFAAHLEQYKGRVNHSTAGAQHAVSAIAPWGRLLAYVIAGHHAGLADAYGGASSLEGRLNETVEPYDGAPAELLHAGGPLSLPALTYDPSDRSRVSFQVALFTRMLFSCLVDADFLATEAFMNPTESAARPTERVPLQLLLGVLDGFLTDLSSQSEPTDVNQRRAESQVGPALPAARGHGSPIVPFLSIGTRRSNLCLQHVHQRRGRHSRPYVTASRATWAAYAIAVRVAGVLLIEWSPTRSCVRPDFSTGQMQKAAISRKKPRQKNHLVRSDATFVRSFPMRSAATVVPPLSL